MYIETLVQQLSVLKSTLVQHYISLILPLMTTRDFSDLYQSSHVLIMCNKILQTAETQGLLRKHGKEEWERCR